MPRQSHPPWSDHPNNIWWNVQVMKLIMQCFPAPTTPASPTLLGPNILPSTLFWNINETSLYPALCFIRPGRRLRIFLNPKSGSEQLKCH
jgi:hypothetical protein